MTPLRQRTLALLFALGVVLCALPVCAEEAPDASVQGRSWLAAKTPAAKHAPVAQSPTVGLGRSLGVLLLTSILGGFALYLRARNGRSPRKPNNNLRVVSSTRIAGRAQLVLAEVAGRQILLGVTDSSVQKLGWLDGAEAEEDEYAALAPRPRLVNATQEFAPRTVRAEPRVAPAAAPAANPRSFRDLLKSAVGNFGRAEEDSAADSIADDTRDTFTRSASAPRAATAPRPVAPTDTRKNLQLLYVEGQARGLIARLGEPRA